MNNHRYYLQCIECQEIWDKGEVFYTCPKCDGLLSVQYKQSMIPSNLKEIWKERKLEVWKYRELLPIDTPSHIISIGEGGTSLNKCLRISKKIGLKHFYAKNEGQNPTGSFKDRGMTIGVSKAIELGMERVTCASTGNTSASLSAYAAKAGLQCLVLIPAGKVAFGKLTQAIIHGALVIQIKGNFDDAMRIIREICITHKIYLLNSINPFRLEGQKTIAFEIWDQLKGRSPDKIFVPVGNAGNISAIWKGFKELNELGLISNLPQMIAIQASGASPIASSVMQDLSVVQFIENPETIATAIRIGSPVNWKKAIQAIFESKGFAEVVSDTEILYAQRLLAQLEGLFVEPASASSVAGMFKAREKGLIEKEEEVVCVVTGHGLKDPGIVLDCFPSPIKVEATTDAVLQVLTSGETNQIQKSVVGTF